MSYEQIRYDVRDRIATITLDRPQARNGYTVQMADELADAIRRADGDEQVRVIVLTGAGSDFCVGADLTGGLDLREGDPVEDWVEPATRVVRPLYESNTPVVAAVRGAAVGVGSTMLLAADYRIAAEDARFGFVFARRGLFPEGASTWFLPRIVGLGRALDWMISGRLIPAAEALSSGLVHRVCPAEDVLTEAYALAAELATTTAPVSVAVIRQALLQMSSAESPDAAFALDSLLIASCADNPDTVEGVLSFLQHRPPGFTGRVPADLPPFLPWAREAAPTDDRKERHG